MSELWGEEDIPTLEDAKDDGFDIVIGCAIELINRGRSREAVPYLEWAQREFDYLLERHMEAYNILEAFGQAEGPRDSEHGYVVAKVDTRLLNDIECWLAVCNGTE